MSTPPQTFRSKTRQNIAEGSADKIPTVSFTSFILSLGTSALIHIGEEVNPATGLKQADLPNARQVVDLLTLLKEKTRGNLERDEEDLISQLLYTLRMKVVALEKK